MYTYICNLAHFIDISCSEFGFARRSGQLVNWQGKALEITMNPLHKQSRIRQEAGKGSVSGKKAAEIFLMNGPEIDTIGPRKAEWR
jgi:hypothetical protein